MDRYRLILVGPFGLFTPDGRRIEITSAKGMALIALVVMAPGGVRARRKLEALLWGNRGQKQAQDSLRRELSNLRKLLAEYGAEQLLVTETKRVSVAIERIDVDIFALGLGHPDARGRIAAELLEGLDLPDCDAFEDWLREERERVHAMIELDRPVPPVPDVAATEVFGGEVPGVEEALAASSPRLPPKPSVAVLPFLSTATAQQDWLGAGIADEISVSLSSFPQLFIVSSNGARMLVEQGVEHAAIGQRLGVRYLLEGTVVRDGNQLRVSVALVVAASGEQVWAGSFIGDADGSFTLQNQIAARIAPQIWTKVDHAERQRGLRLIGSVSGDYERYWRANALSRSWDRESIAEAIALAMELVEHDPTCPWATSLAAYCNSIAWMLNHSPDREAVRRRAITHYQAAMRYGADNVEALGYCAGTLVNIRGDMELADRIIASALHILPSHQPALFWGGWVDVVRGEPVRAAERFELALRINPISGVQGQTLAGIGYTALQQGDAHTAFRLLAEADRATPGFPPTQLGLCVAAQLVGQTELARAYAGPLIEGGGLNLIGMLCRDADRILFTQALTTAAG
ncbi:hypothetical protein K9B35_19360 [Sphingomonas sp. R647]|uniref:hypothetical protein n=1 Tax=Sphingomonas sp. R647 TaxID=2875233 RepID=UPI001CD4BDA8|nr:hypothetical protein [Sphingomonas sp. R647]MCA1200131.1 hypothetical protein [Sphingomonas sp. R647]